MSHVAALAGVGIKTVSRVINDEPGVSEDTRQRVLRASEQLNYQLDMAAGSLRRTGRRTLSIGLLLPSVSNPFSGEIHRAIEDALGAGGLRFLRRASMTTPGGSRPSFRRFLAGASTGSSSPRSPEARRMSSRSIPGTCPWSSSTASR